MSASIRSSADGSQAILAVNGADKLTVNSDGTVVASASPPNGDNSKKLVTSEFVHGSVIGKGQTVQTLTGSRALNTTYYNTTGRAIMVYVQCGNPVGVSVMIDGIEVAGESVAYCYAQTYQFLVPAGSSYKFNITGGTLAWWKELR